MELQTELVDPSDFRASEVTHVSHGVYVYICKQPSIGKPPSNFLALVDPMERSPVRELLQTPIQHQIEP